MVGAPGDFAVTQIECRQAAANSEFAAADTDIDFVLHHQRRHCQAFTEIDIGDLSPPHGFARVGIDRNRLTVESVDDDLSISEHGAAVHNVAARNALGCCSWCGLEGPLRRRAGFGEVERVHEIWVRRHDVHRVVNNERCRLLAPVDAQRESRSNTQRTDVGRVNLSQLAVAAARIILGWTDPLSVVGCIVCNRDRAG